jgi:hypothetical protein
MPVLYPTGSEFEFMSTIEIKEHLCKIDVIYLPKVLSSWLFSPLSSARPRDKDFPDVSEIEISLLESLK